MRLTASQKLQILRAYREEGGSLPYTKVLSQFRNGGYLPESGLPEKDSTIVDSNNNMSEPVLTGMMKARMAIAAQMGNTSAQRMTSVYPKRYEFTGNEQINGENIGVPKGEVGTHFMSSMGEYAVPFIQERNNKLQFVSNPRYNDAESMRFESPEDAEYFAEHYKDVAPMMQSFATGGELPEDPPVTNLSNYIRDTSSSNDNTNYKSVPLRKGEPPIIGGTLPTVEIKASNTPKNYRNDPISRREDIKTVPITKNNIHNYPVSVQNEFMKQQVADRPDYEAIRDFENFAATGFGLAPMGIFDKAITFGLNKLPSTITNAKNLIKPTPKPVDIVANNLRDLEYAKNYFSKYGYDIPTNLSEIAQDSKLTNETIQGLVNQHNTFVRGVSTNWAVIGKNNPEILKHLERQGIDYINNPQSAAEYMSTHVPIQTGYGRAGLNQNVFREGKDAIYTSNSIPTAEGYTYGDGYIVKVKRPTDFSSKNRIDWINSNKLDYFEDNLKTAPKKIKDKFLKLTEERYIKEIEPKYFDKNGNWKNGKVLQKELDYDNWVLEQEIRQELGLSVEKQHNLLKHEGSNKTNLNKILDEDTYPDLFIGKLDIQNKDFHLKNLDEITKTIGKKYNTIRLNLENKISDLPSNSQLREQLIQDINNTRINAIKEVKTEQLNYLKENFPKEINEVDRYAHYLHIGTPGQKLLEPIEAIRITPDIWKNKSRAHTNVFSKGLTAGSLIPLYISSQLKESFGDGGEIPNTVKSPYAFPIPSSIQSSLQVNNQNSSTKDISDTVYKINYGDTLTSISKKFNTPINDIAAYNAIEDPNKIQANAKILIPKLYDKELKIEEIPETHHKNIIIDNYSKRYDYIVQGDKTYYKVKNGDTWKDISDNPEARKNLYKFLDTKYNLKGYSEDEKIINSQIKSNTYNYDSKYPESKVNSTILSKPASSVDKYLSEYNKPYNKKTHLDLFTFWEDATDKNGKQYLPLPLVATTQNGLPNANYNASSTNALRKVPSKQIELSNKNNTVFDNIADAISNSIEFIEDKAQQAWNGISRRYKKTSDDVEPSTKFVYRQIPNNSDYEIRQPNIVGDTLKIDKDKYYLPEVIDLNKVKLGTRNRGDMTPLKTEGAVVTAFNPFIPYNEIDKTKVSNTDNFIGVDDKGRLKVGNFKDFNSSYKITKTFKNTVIDFVRDDKGEIVYTKRNKDNPNNPVPNVRIIDDNGKEVIGSLNILTKKGNKDAGTYGQITGGRTIMKAGDETLLVSGSMKDIEAQFNKLKKLYGKVDIYTLDNGSYVRGLRTFNKELNSKQLKEYDLQNTGGGNFAYLNGDLDNVYKENVYKTPNVRTKDDDSFKNGHPLKNEMKGIVLHHTAYTEPSLDEVHKYFMTKGNNSAHVVIGYNGERNVYASPEQVTFHAGKSNFKGRDNVNDFMLGVEFQGDTNKKHLTEDQIYSAVEYLYPIIVKNNIQLENITTHHRVSGERKPDINEQDYNAIIAILKQKIYRKK